MVVLSAAGLLATWLGGVAGVSADPYVMPSLTPLTAPPRSDPMFLSFLVPNTMTTISSTISQCQMEKEPMEYLLTNCNHFRRGALQDCARRADLRECPRP